VVIDNGTGTTAAEFTGSTGAAGTQTSNLVFDVDGNTVTVNSDHSGNLTALVADIQGQLNTASAGTWTVAADGAAGFSITSNAVGTAAPTVVNNFQTTSITGASGGTSVTAVDTVAASTLTLGANELQFTIGTGSTVSVAAGTYSTAQSLVDAVNTALGGNATAELNSTTNVMSFTSGEAITVDTDAQSVMTGASFTASGSLATVDITTVANANTTIQRIDAALTSVSSLRSDFGAVQNRFESTIANLSTTAENISASRSRIRDADFAAETAELTRTQILQQAGVAMLAQANAMPQSVLSLLQ
jgi:flagellin